MTTFLFILFVIFAIIVFAGAIMSVFNIGAEEGICKYTNVGEDE